MQKLKDLIQMYTYDVSIDLLDTNSAKEKEAVVEKHLSRLMEKIKKIFDYEN
jgi:hypothetical protein